MQTLFQRLAKIQKIVFCILAPKEGLETINIARHEMSNRGHEKQKIHTPVRIFFERVMGFEPTKW
ncbi:MAG: hypothetical protein JSV61_12445 [Anaerolineales bacterium]|nr:MAG: hypothetical protein JSV61_12445 [Anaerolineales bacterium]